MRPRRTRLLVQEEDSSHVRIRKLHRGFTSLPDELLSIVLEDASIQSDSFEWMAMIKSVKAAVKLSHVCQRFQKVIIHHSNVWNRLTNNMESIEMIATCISRCRTTDATLYLQTPFHYLCDHHHSPSPVDTFLRLAGEKPDIWRKLVLDCRGLYLIEDFRAEKLKELESTKGMVLPHLAELVIRYHDILTQLGPLEDSFNKILHCYSTWSTPRLRSMRTQSFIPIPFSGSPSLTSLSIKIGPPEDSDLPRAGGFDLNVDAIWSFFSTCPALEELTLWICGATHAIVPNFVRPLKMTCVNKIDFTFVRSFGTPIRSIFGVVHFPNASTVRLCMDWPTDGELEDWIEISDASCDSIVLAVFQNEEVFPNLARLDIVEHYWDSEYYGDFRRSPISVPLQYMPRLQHIDICASRIANVAGGQTLPAVRSLALKGSSSDFPIKAWLIRFLRRLEEQGDLATLQRVHFANGCPELLNLNPVGLAQHHEPHPLSYEDYLKFSKPLTLSNEDLRKLIQR